MDFTSFPLAFLCSGCISVNLLSVLLGKNSFPSFLVLSKAKGFRTHYTISEATKSMHFQTGSPFLCTGSLCVQLRVAAAKIKELLCLSKNLFFLISFFDFLSYFRLTSKSMNRLFEANK